jgi:hypothetical protein
MVAILESTGCTEDDESSPQSGQTQMTFFAGKVKATRPLVLTGCPGTLELRHISLPSYAARTVVQLAVHGTLQVTPYRTRIDRGSAAGFQT